MAKSKKPRPPAKLGRPPKAGGVRTSIRLSRRHIEIAQQLGGGEMTRGIEIALDRAAKSVN